MTSQPFAPTPAFQKELPFVHASSSLLTNIKQKLVTPWYESWLFRSYMSPLLFPLLNIFVEFFYFRQYVLNFH